MALDSSGEKGIILVRALSFQIPIKILWALNIVNTILNGPIYRFTEFLRVIDYFAGRIYAVIYIYACSFLFCKRFRPKLNYSNSIFNCDVV